MTSFVFIIVIFWIKLNYLLFSSLLNLTMICEFPKKVKYISPKPNQS